MKRPVGVLSLLIGLLALPLVTASSPASALAPPAPALSSPANAATPPRNPTLKWVAVSGAARYRVEVSTNPSFSSNVVYAQDTYNTAATPPNDLALVTHYWRVRARNAANEDGAWSETRSFTPMALGAPDPVFPLTGNYLSFPSEAAVIDWTGVAGAKDYELQIDDENDFTPPFTVSIATRATAYSLVNPQAIGQTYYWRVRARSQGDLASQFSETQSYTVAWSEVESDQSTPPPAVPRLIAPKDSNDLPIEEVVFGWDPVPGAANYDLQVSPAQDFSGGLTLDVTGIRGTRYSPPTTINNSAYFWRVRARNAGGAIGNWSTVFEFTRAWPSNVLNEDGVEVTPPNSAVKLLTPINGASTNMPTFSWEPQRLAARYEIQLATDQFFSTGKGSCVTQQTTFTPITGSNGCDPRSAGEARTYYWRVRAIDDTLPVEGVWSTPSLYTNTPWTTTPGVAYQTTLTAPVNCLPQQQCPDERMTPTLRWDPVPGATSYEVSFAFDPNFTNDVDGRFNYSTKYTTLTPTTTLPESQAGQAIYWYARPCGLPGPSLCGPEPAFFVNDPNTPVRAFRKRSIPVVPLTPLTTEVAEIANDIRFDWEDYLVSNLSVSTPEYPTTQAARKYRVQVSTTADFSVVIDTSPDLDQTEYTAFGKTYPEGPLYWRVQALDGFGRGLAWSPTQQLEKQAPPLALETPGNFATVSEIPVLSWAPQTFAKRYEVEVYKSPDAPLSNANRVFTAVTGEAAWVPTQNLPAGDYGWRVRRLDADDRPGPWTVELNSLLRRFTVKGDPAEPLSPGNGATLLNNTLLYQWEEVPGAARYRIEVSTNSNFTAPLKETVDTVMSQWAPTVQYADGQYWWRVTTLDGAGNPLRTSAPFNFRKEAGNRGEFFPLSPARILDTRAAGGPLGPKQPRTVQITTKGGVPATGVSAVVANVTVVGPSEASFLKVWPDGSDRPPVSSLNYVAGQTIPNLVTVKVGSGGRIRIENDKGTANVLIDVVGYYTDGASQVHGARFQTTPSPVRILDTRTLTPPRPFGPDETRAVKVAGSGTGGVPADASAVVLNATVTGGSADSDLRIWPKGVERPNASNLNFTPGLTIANLVVVKVGDNGEVNVRNNKGTVNVVFDAVGWFEDGDPAPGDRFTALDPARIVDTRQPGALGAGGRLEERVNRTIKVTNKGGIPASGVKSVVMNVTVAAPAGAGFLTIWPGTNNVPTRPQASNINFASGQSIPNLVVAKVDANGNVQAYSTVDSDVIFDVVGWYG